MRMRRLMRVGCAGILNHQWAARLGFYRYGWLGSAWMRSCLALLVLSLAGSRASFADPVDIRRDATVLAVEKVLPSVVNIATETVIEYHEWYDAMLRNFYGWPRTPVHQEKSTSLGSGVIIDDDGYVLTNLHVVRRANRIQVKLWDGREYEAETMGSMPGTDVALLKLKAKPGEKFKAIKLAPDDDLLLGETVIALGNPYGLGGSVTKGILSSKNRRPSTGDEPLDVQDWLQTDAAINPGNSGGPLVNLRGELIGLNVAVYRETDGQRGLGVGFSIPVKQVSAALSRFFTPEATDSLWFGAQFKPGSNPVEVLSVQPGGPAAKSGLQENDLILEVNGTRPRNLIECNRLLACESRSADLLVRRSGREQKLSVKLLSFDELVRHRLGLTVLEVSPQAAAGVGVRAGEALLIDKVEKGSPADQAQIERGYLLTSIDGQGASSLRTVAEVLGRKKKGDTVHLVVVVPRRLGAFVELQQAAAEVPLRE
ncbi:MAG TPA: trypsin-like peptidase domain-containing protein [Verrucomicrobiae bacterium]|nr:trypsin-like peptidase domain-containing protein [Verrucomicrobiae bacterium]